MNDIVKAQLWFDSPVLPDDLADRLLAGIEDSQATTLVAGGGKDLIKLSKNDGTWNIGQADEPMQVGSKWWINICYRSATATSAGRTTRAAGRTSGSAR